MNRRERLIEIQEKIEDLLEAKDFAAEEPLSAQDREAFNEIIEFIEVLLQ